MKTYLGDSVYAEYRNGHIILTTNNGLGDTNTIYLDGEVFAALVTYVSKISKETQDEAMRD